MLTRKETALTLSIFKVFSICNIFPIHVDVNSGKIGRESNQVKVFIWKFFFCVGVFHFFYVFGRLVQSTILEPQKYFRWDHFVLHFGNTCCYGAFYFTGFRLFVKSPEENVMIFNQLFSEREDSIQKMMDQQQMTPKSANRNKGAISASGNKPRGKSGARLLSTSGEEEIGMEVIENGSQSESKSDSEVRPRPLLTWPPQYSLDELMAKLIPLIAVCSYFCAILIFAIDPTRPHLLYSALPPEYQNSWSFFSLLAVEAICLAIVFFAASFALVTQLLFLGKCQLEFKRIDLQLRNVQLKFQTRSVGGRDIRREIWILRQVLKEMRELVVLIELFNRCFPFCIFAWKLCSMAMCILYYFFVIRHHEDFPFLGLFIGYCAIALTLVYSIMYARAFSIPGKMDELKNEFLLTAQKTTNLNVNISLSRILWAEMKREIKRIHGVGIKVGSFHQMERESTPRFIDFILRNVVNLLVTFPRQR